MAQPTEKVRREVYARDRGRCLVCGRPELTFQHRRRVGQGGSKIRPVHADGLAMCRVHNDACEAEMQTVALAQGWKVRSWVANPELVPVFDVPERQWYVLVDAIRAPIPAASALRMMVEVYGEEFYRWRSSIV